MEALENEFRGLESKLDRIVWGVLGVFCTTGLDVIVRVITKR